MASSLPVTSKSGFFLAFDARCPMGRWPGQGPRGGGNIIQLEKTLNAKAMMWISWKNIGGPWCFLDTFGSYLVDLCCDVVDKHNPALLDMVNIREYP